MVFGVSPLLFIASLHQAQCRTRCRNRRNLARPYMPLLLKYHLYVSFYHLKELLKLTGTGVKDKRDEGRTQVG